MPGISKKKQLSIGVFVLLALGALGFLVTVFGDSSGIRGTYLLHCEVGNTGGPVKRGAPVRMMGIPVGKVASVKLKLDTKTPTVLLELEIYEEFLIKSDSLLKVEQATFIGDRVVQIYPGTEGVALKDGGQLESEPSMNIDKVIEDVQATVQGFNLITKGLTDSLTHIDTLLVNVNNLVVTLDSLVGNKEFGQDLHSTLKSLSVAAGHLEGITNKVNKGKGSLGRLVNEDEFVEELNTTVKSLRRLVAELRAEPSQVFWGKDDGPAPRELSIEELTDMVKSGLKTATIVAQIEACNATYTLTAELLLDLKKKGFDDNVLEAMILSGR